MCNGNSQFSDYFRVLVGIVSGLDSVLINENHGFEEIITNENTSKKIILVKNFPTKNNKLNYYLLENKQKLISRRIRKFNETNWFSYGALRNIQTVEDHTGAPCIYINTLTRNIKVAFVSSVKLFGSNLLCMIPKKKDSLDLQKVCNYINSQDFKKNFTFSGRFKIGQRNLSLSMFNFKYL
jgi:adenine-specific DNA-methyltransferase